MGIMRGCKVMMPRSLPPVRLGPHPCLHALLPPAGGHLSDMVGSSFYIAPEVLRGRYGFAADMWSAGVIVYIMLSGCAGISGAAVRDGQC